VYYNISLSRIGDYYDTACNLGLFVNNMTGTKNKIDAANAGQKEE
jgi:hypothetical protein